MRLHWHASLLTCQPDMSAGTLCKCRANPALGLAIWYTIPISLRPLQSAAAATQQPAADEVVDDDEMNPVVSYLLRTLERNYILFQMFQKITIILVYSAVWS